MPIIPLECPSCGANLSINSDDSAAICSYCGKPFVIKDAIVNNYIKSVVSIKADTVNIISNNDFEIVAGVLKKYNGAAIDVTIPETVIEIGYRAFENTKLRSVICPSSLKIVGSEAFSGCSSLISIKFSNNINRIHDGAFKQCTALTSIILPDGIESIEQGVFALCSSLTSIHLPSSIKQISKRAFAYCTSLISISFPDGLERIADAAFENCQSLTSVTIPKGTKVAANAFVNNPKLSLSLPSSITQFDRLRIMTAKTGGEIRVIGGVAHDDGQSWLTDANETDIYNNGWTNLILYYANKELGQAKNSYRVSFTTYSFFYSHSGDLQQNKPSEFEGWLINYSKDVDNDYILLQELFQNIGIKNYKISVIKAPIIKSFTSSLHSGKSTCKQVGFRDFLLIQIPNI